MSIRPGARERPPADRGQRPWNYFPSPLRYPGGKRRLAPFVAALVEANALEDGDYAEVYAGGAAIALDLLFGEYVRRIHINDLDPAVHAFWLAARDSSDELCRRIHETPLTIEEWRRQKAVYEAVAPNPIDLAFATLFLNRTNRSGILTAGPVGGYAQAGDWKLDARFRREDLIRRVQKIGRYAARIEVYGLDALVFLRDIAPSLPSPALIYLDPPYYVKGTEHLYVNSYETGDHASVASALSTVARPWLVTYDDAPAIRELYRTHHAIAYEIPYTAHTRYRGSEVAFTSPGMRLPAHLPGDARLRPFGPPATE